MNALTDDDTIELAKDLVLDTIQVMAEVSDEYGPEAANIVLYSYLSSLIGSILTSALNSGKKSKSSKLAQERFANAKQNIATSVAAGISGAMSNFSGENVEYYCILKPIPAPANKEPC